MSTLLSFHNDEAIREKYLRRVEAHQKADEIIQGKYWERGRGCAVGCTIHGSYHGRFETELGIPRILARLEDRIFEGLSNEDAKTFPLRFLSAVPIGVDLVPVWKNFFVWLLVDENDGVIRFSKQEQTKRAIADVAALIQKGILEEVSKEQYLEVRKAAADAAADAYADAYAAADAAYAAAAAAAAYAYAAADDASKKSHYKKMADKLIELLAAAS